MKAELTTRSMEVFAREVESGVKWFRDRTPEDHDALIKHIDTVRNHIEVADNYEAVIATHFALIGFLYVVMEVVKQDDLRQQAEGN